jgi:hypothetical protein
MAARPSSNKLGTGHDRELPIRVQIQFLARKLEWRLPAVRDVCLIAAEDLSYFAVQNRVF